jgi:hypothetical protein
VTRCCSYGRNTRSRKRIHTHLYVLSHVRVTIDGGHLYTCLRTLSLIHTFYKSHAKSFQFAFTNRFLVTDLPTLEILQLHALKSSLHRIPYRTDFQLSISQAGGYFTPTPLTSLHNLTVNWALTSGIRLSPLGTAATSGLLYKPQMIDEGDCGAIGGMEIGRGNRSTRRKPAPAPLCPPQIPHDQTRARTRAAAVGSQRLTAWAMVRPHCGMSTD